MSEQGIKQGPNGLLIIVFHAASTSIHNFSVPIPGPDEWTDQERTIVACSFMNCLAFALACGMTLSRWNTVSMILNTISVCNTTLIYLWLVNVIAMLIFIKVYGMSIHECFLESINYY